MSKWITCIECYIKGEKKHKFKYILNLIQPKCLDTNEINFKPWAPANPLELPKGFWLLDADWAVACEES